MSKKSNLSVFSKFAGEEDSNVEKKVDAFAPRDATIDLASTTAPVPRSG